MHTPFGQSLKSAAENEKQAPEAEINQPTENVM